MPPTIAFPSTILSKPFLSLEPDMVESQAAERVTRGARSQGSLSGAANTEVDPAPQILRRTFAYHCTSRAEIAALRAFFRARKARREAFWFIDWQLDVMIDPYWEFNFLGFHLWTAPRQASDGVTSYGTSLYPLGAFYRYLLFTRGLGWAIWKIVEVLPDTPAGSGLERLGFNLIDQSDFHGGPAWNAGAPYTLDRGFRPLWLRYGRFDTDTLALEVHSSDEAIAQLPIVDLPLETPT